MILSQDNKCNICKNKFVDKKKIHIDHDHESKKVRGLLCINCNIGIGMLKDSQEILQSAINYLNYHKN
jgi:hypothetical protein